MSGFEKDFGAVAFAYNGLGVFELLRAANFLVSVAFLGSSRWAVLRKASISCGSLLFRILMLCFWAARDMQLKAAIIKNVFFINEKQELLDFKFNIGNRFAFRRK